MILISGEHLTEPIEGHYIETPEGLLFAVKGLSHPEKLVIAYLRYVPDPEGDRVKDACRYRRVYELNETDEYLRRNYPHYLNTVESKNLTLQSVPIEKISRVYSPKERLRTLLERQESELEETTAEFIHTISSESGVSYNDLGVSGSILLGLARETSDIDIVVYGIEAGRKAYNALKRLRAIGNWVRPYNSETVIKIARDRWGDTGLELDNVYPIEARKVLHGLVGGRDYFVRLVRKPREFEQEVSSRPHKKMVVRALVVDSEESIYTPCSYTIKECSYTHTSKGPDVVQLMSYRGKFTEQAGYGDLVEARGTLEEAIYPDRKIYRMMLGGKGDYLFPLSSFDR